MENDNKILGLFGIQSTDEQIQIKYFSIGVLSIIATCVLIYFVLDVGKKTSQYGDRFAYNKLFVVKVDDAKLINDINPEKKPKITIKKGDVFVLKDIKQGYAVVDPVCDGLSTKTIEWRRSNFSDNNAYIQRIKGDIKTPLEYNVQQLFDDGKGDRNDNYSLGRLLNFFSMRKNIVYLYYVMALFLIIFNYILIKRLIFLYHNHLDQNTINDTLNKKTGRAAKLNQLVKDEKATVPYAFISALHNSYKLDGSRIQFNNIYNDFLERDKQLEQTFSEKISLCNVWIIRAGIFGTLVGLIIAFFELYIAVGGIEPGVKLTENFIAQIQQALLGNALSIATSISAHGASLVLELFVVSLVSGDSNIPWIEATYLNVLHFKEYKPEVKTQGEAIAVMSAAVDEMTIEFDLVTNSLKDLSPGAQTTRELIDAMNAALLQINDGLDSINKDLEETKKTTENFKLIGSEINYKVMDTKKLVEDAHEKMQKLHEESTAFSSYLRKNIDSFRTVAGGAIENTQSIISSLSNKLRAMKDNINK